MFKNTPQPTPEEISAALAAFEAEKITRRRALKKFGITTGMAIFGMFAADDLARMVIQKMEEHKETRQIAEVVALELNNTGIAFASPVCGAGGCGDTQLTFNCNGCPATPGTTGTNPIEGGNCNNCVQNACNRCFGVATYSSEMCVSNNTCYGS